ncbi:MAG: VWA domain-containing protein [Gemmatimonadota bacterium]
MRRVPSAITEDRLVGGLDFAATIAAGRPIAERGVLASAHGGTIVLDAGRTRRATWSHVARALDDGEVVVERDGIAERHEASFAAVALEEEDGRPAPAAFADRVAFHVDLDGESDPDYRAPEVADLAAARARLRDVTLDDAAMRALVQGAHELGIGATRIVLAAMAVARAHAALHGRTVVVRDDLSAAARLVLAPRALALPECEDSDAQDAPQTDAADRPRSDADAQPQGADTSRDREETPPSNDESGEALASVVVCAARAALPPGLLTASAALAGRREESTGRAGDERPTTRGRQVGTRRGDPRTGARLDIVATLRAAVPFQSMRRRESGANAGARVRLRADDLRIRRCVSHAATTTVFVLDASGSAALHRLAEAKGAIELMLTEGYARRERVAVIAFRGTTAELVLPPTHALARARRAIAALPAGGGTPLATALDLALVIVREAARDGSSLSTIILTDGRANVARDGKGGRGRAESDALDAARRLAAAGASTVFIDTAPRQERFAREVAAAMNGRYVMLPAPTAQGLASLALSTHAPPVHAHG